MTELLYAKHLGTTSSQPVFGLRWEICEHAVRKKEKKCLDRKVCNWAQNSLNSAPRTGRIEYERQSDQKARNDKRFAILRYVFQTRVRN